MSIVSNFNTIYLLKRFNNYFNRKIYGGASLTDYISGDSGAAESKTVELTESDFSLIDGTPTAVISLNVPVNKSITIDSIVVSGDTEAYTATYKVIDRELTIVSTGTVLPPLGTSVIITYSYSQYEFEKRENINFNPNDDVLTEIVINNLSFESDYLLVIDENSNIVSRWFILETVRTRSLQARLSLRRDVIYDNLNKLQSSPVYVQKGMLSEDDSFIVNSEGMSVNEIKSYEGLLQDITKCAWIVGYIAKNTTDTSVSDADTGLSTIISTSRKPTSDQEFDMFAIPYGNLTIDDVGAGSFENATAYNLTMAATIARTLDAKCYDIQLLPYCPVSEVIAGDNRIELDMAPGGEHTGFEYIKQTVASGSKTIRLTRDDFIVQPVLPPAQPTSLRTGWLSNSDLGVGEGATLSNFATVQLVINTGHTVSASYNYDGERLRITISPFDDHTFPTELVLDFNFDYTGTSDEKIGVILYCKSSTFTRQLFLAGAIPGDDFSNLNKKESSNLLKFRFVSPNYQGSFEFNGAKNKTPNLYQIYAKGIYTYCTYKPYTPFIKIAPEYEFLYGENYGDARGLICGGDFSLPRSTDAWESFQLNNKNYQNIFNREIQNMDFNYTIEQRNAAISGGVGVLTGAASGAAAGAIAGSIIPGLGTAVGAVVGGAAGALTSGVGLALDLDTNARKYRENKSLAVDKFNYQLGNIKALPYTLTKVGAFDICSKIWPILEMYHCTNEELTAFRNKIKYESMTVMRIDYISNFYHKFDDLCYFKGELIRNDEIAADNHILDAIYAELLKGVYF